MKRRFLNIILAALLATVSLLSSAQGQGVSVNLAYQMQPNHRMQLDVISSGVQNTGAISMVIKMNPLAVISVVSTNTHTTAGTSLVNYAAGNLYYSWFSTQAVNFDTLVTFILQTYTFGITDLVFDSTQGSCELATVQSQVIPATWNSGYGIDVTPISKLWGTLFYADSTPMPNITVIFSGAFSQKDYMTQSDSTGHYEAMIPNDAYWITLVPADTNVKQAVNATDALLAMRYFLQLNGLDSLQIRAADMNGDKAVNATDALEIVKLQTGQTNFLPPEILMSTATDKVALNGTMKRDIYFIRKGDVNKSYLP